MRAWIFALFVTFMASPLWASKVKFEAKLSHNRVEVGQRFQISFTMNARGGNFTPPEFKNFRLLSGPNRSSSTQIINGDVSQSTTFSYILAATKEGNLAIGQATLEIDGDNYKTRPLEVQVVAASENSANAQRNRQQQRKQGGDEISDLVFIRAIVDKRSAYVGEKITVTYKLYTQLRLSNPQMESMPSLTGFWHQELRSIFKDEVGFKEERVGNKIFNVAEIQQNILYPQRAGELTIDPLKLKFIATVRKKRSRSIYDQMFGSYERKEVIAGSDPIQIKVKPLPLANRPLNFSGAVGQFNAKLIANKAELKSNEAVDVKLEIKGQGNLPLIGAPELNFPPDFEVYDPETENKYQTNYTGSNGSKIFKYLVIPRHAGEYEIEPYTFSYFDLQSETYKSIKTQDLQFNVARGNEEESVVYRADRKQEVELLNSDIRYIHLNNLSLQAAGEQFYGSLRFYMVWLCSFSAFLLLWLIARRKKEKEGDRVGMRKAKANKMAKKRLAKAKKHFDSGEKSAFYEEISEALFGYYADKYNIEKAELSQERIVETLEQDDLSILASDLKNTLESAEMARFAPSSAVAPDKLYQDAMELISKTENRKA
ncbi:MAG: BatD family protein [Vicingaceae bacterium]